MNECSSYSTKCKDCCPLLNECSGCSIKCKDCCPLKDGKAQNAPASLLSARTTAHYAMEGTKCSSCTVKCKDCCPPKIDVQKMPVKAF